jgi:lysozyme
MIPVGFDVAAMAVELIHDEAIRLTVYDDANGQEIGPGSHVIGHPTIGAGRALDLNGISHAESLVMLATDIQGHLDALMQIDWFTRLDPARQRAIVNMVHQMGVHGVLGFFRMIECIRRDDWTGAAKSGQQSTWARQTPARANRVMAQLLQGASPCLT